MEEETQSEPQSSAVKPVSYNVNSGRGRAFLKFLLVLLIIAGVGGGVWYWQQQKIKELQGQVTTLQGEKAKLSEDLATLQSAADKAKENNVEVTYSDVIRDTDGRYSNGKADVIIVSFTAENKGTSTQTVSAKDFKLTDAKDKVIATYADTAELIQAVKSFGLPDKLSVFTTATVEPGKKITGSLVFWNTDTTNSNFKATYKGKTSDIKVTKTTRVCDRDGTTCEKATPS